MDNDIKYVYMCEELGLDNKKYKKEEMRLIVEYGILVYEKTRNVPIGNMKDVLEKVKEEMLEEYEMKMMCMNEKLEQLNKEKEGEIRIRNYENEKKSQDIENALRQQKCVFDMLEKQHANEREMYRDKIVYLEKEMEKMREMNNNQKMLMESRINEKVNDRIHGELKMMQHIMDEKEKQNEKLRVLFESSMEKLNKMNIKKDVVSIGKHGENQFMQLAMQTFRDFDGFEIEDVHKYGGSGDFHIQFKDFNILVDSKLYSGKVNSTSREKIKRDLMKNEHIHFAWLVSLDTTIDRYDKAPFMFEWLSSQQCVCYVNCLMKNEEPSEILRGLYFCCKTLYDVMRNEEQEMSELTELRKKQLLIKEIGQKMVKNKRERETLMTQLIQNMEKGDEYIKELLNNETNAMVDEYMNVLLRWWQMRVVKSEDVVDVDMKVLTSTMLWNQFKKDNAELSKKMDINMFKKMVVDMDNVVLVHKGNSFHVVGMKIKV